MKVVALAGNPNCGKTSLFNILTGDEQKVGNWPGVTVEKKTGEIKSSDLLLVDLPGIYSLSPYSPEEAVARDFLLNERPDLILNLIDGTNLQRNLYLTEQLLTLEIPMIAAVTFMDEVEASGKKLDVKTLSEQLKIPVILVSSRTLLGVDNLISALNAPAFVPENFKFEAPLEEHILKLMKKPEISVPKRFYVEKYLEGDDFETFDCAVERDKLLTSCNTDGAVAIASARYDIAEKTTLKCLIIPEKHILNVDKLDTFMLHPVLGIPIFFLVLILMFSLVFGPFGQFLTGVADNIISGFIIPEVSLVLCKFKVSSWVSQLVLQAVVGGVGNVVKFVPQIGLLFFCLSFLEDSGYLARGAFLMDGFLKRMGLSGKSFLPIMLGFGCTTSAVMAARATENRAEHQRTVFLLPFLSCGAKTAVYALFVGAFFSAIKGAAIAIIYILGIILAVFAGIIDRKLSGKLASSGFVMELPKYRMPAFKNLIKSSWRPCKDFIIRAGTLIFIMNIILWLFQSITPDLKIAADSSESIFAIWGEYLAPLFLPLGFGTWEAAVSLMSGLVAKEGIVSSFCVLYHTPSYSLEYAIKSAFTPLSAVSYLTFSMLYIPCVSALAAILKESGVKALVKTIAVQTCSAYIISFLIYRLGSLLGFQ